MSDDSYTEDIGKFGSRERKMAAELLSHDLPENFYDEGVKLAMNTNSGCVFLVNEDYQTAMMNGDKLEIFHSTPYEGHEGFLSDLLDELEPGDLNADDVRYLKENAEIEGVELPLKWQDTEDED